MEPISGKIGEKGYIFSIMRNKTVIYYDRASSKRITSEIIQAWSPPAKKLEKKAVFPSYCGCERSTSEMKQSHLMAEPKYILGRHDMFLPYESLPQQQGNNILCNCR